MSIDIGQIVKGVSEAVGALKSTSTGGTENSSNDDALLEFFSDSSSKSTDDKSNIEKAMQMLELLGGDEIDSQTADKTASLLENLVGGILSGDGLSQQDAQALKGAIGSVSQLLSGNDLSSFANALTKSPIEQISSSMGSFLSALIPADSNGNVNIAGVDMQSSDVAQWGAESFSDLTTASVGIFSDFSSSINDVLNGNKTLDEAFSEFSTKSSEKIEEANKKSDEKTEKLSSKSSADDKKKSEVKEKFSDFFSSSLKSFVSGFFRNGIKTLLTNPAALADPVSFLTQTLLSTLSDKQFQKEMVQNTSTLIGSKNSSKISSLVSNASKSAKTFETISQLAKNIPAT